MGDEHQKQIDFKNQEYTYSLEIKTHAQIDFGNEKTKEKTKTQYLIQFEGINTHKHVQFQL